MDSEQFCEGARPLLEKAEDGGAQVQERQEIRPLSFEICLLGAQRYKSLGEVGKTSLSTKVFEIAWCNFVLGSEHGTDIDLEGVLFSITLYFSVSALPFLLVGHFIEHLTSVCL